MIAGNLLERRARKYFQVRSQTTEASQLKIYLNKYSYKFKKTCRQSLSKFYFNKQIQIHALPLVF